MAGDGAAQTFQRVCGYSIVVLTAAQFQTQTLARVGVRAAYQPFLQQRGTALVSQPRTETPDALLMLLAWSQASFSARHSYTAYNLHVAMLPWLLREAPADPRGWPS